MTKRTDNRGFTIAELLIVVAIIAILVAIAIPTFAGQLEGSREGVDIANIRSAYSQAVTEAMATGKEATAPAVTITQETAGWSSGSLPDWPQALKTAWGRSPASWGNSPGSSGPTKGGTITITGKADGSCTVTYNAPTT